jgi:hypothetical protein
MQPLLGEVQELSKGVAIGYDCVRTYLSLLHQTLRKEARMDQFATRGTAMARSSWIYPR